MTFINFENPINLDIELQVLNMLKDYMVNKLTLYIDEKVLIKKLKQTNKINEQTAIKYILGEIRIVKFFINMSFSCINFLQNNITPETNEFNEYIQQLHF